MKAGRPTKYTDKLGLEICRRIAEGDSVLNICKETKMPSRKTVTTWLLDKDKEIFLRNYEASVNIRTDNMFDDIEEIAGNTKGEVQRDRLRVDTRKWYLSKVMPKKYGDKLDLTSGNKPIQQVTGMVIVKDNEDTIQDKE